MSKAAVPRGPRECPFDKDYYWWEDDDRMVFFGHEVTVTCGGCGGEMVLDSIIGGREFIFACAGCTEEHVHLHGTGTFEHSRSVGISPANCAPSGWNIYGEGFEADVELGEDPGTWTATAEVLTETHQFEIRAPTLAEEVDA